MKAIKTITISILAVGLLAGSAVGVAAQSALVTGGGWSGDDCETTPDGAMFCTGGWQSDDPRLTGEYELAITSLFGQGGEGFEIAEIITGDGRLSNDGGSWTVRYYHPVFAPEEGWVPEGYPLDGLPETYRWVDAGDQYLLTGEAGYEGLMAYLTDGPRGTWGVILEAESLE